MQNGRGKGHFALHTVVAEPKQKNMASNSSDANGAGKKNPTARQAAVAAEDPLSRDPLATTGEGRVRRTPPSPLCRQIELDHHRIDL
jgi:hypothetical protein